MRSHSAVTHGAELKRIARYFKRRRLAAAGAARPRFREDASRKYVTHMHKTLPRKRANRRAAALWGGVALKP